MEYDVNNYGEGNIYEFEKGIDVLEYVLSNYKSDYIDLNEGDIVCIKNTINILYRFRDQYFADL